MGLLDLFQIPRIAASLQVTGWLCGAALVLLLIAQLNPKNAILRFIALMMRPGIFILAASMLLIAAGGWLNITAQVANHGHMPVRLHTLREKIVFTVLVKIADDPVHRAETPQTRLAFLGDVFWREEADGMHWISIGDVCIIFGMATLICVFTLMPYLTVMIIVLAILFRRYLRASSS